MKTAEMVTGGISFEAAITSLKAMINYAQRYAKLAMDLANQEEDPRRKHRVRKSPIWNGSGKPCPQFL